MPSANDNARRMLELFPGNETHHGTHGEPDLDMIGGVKWEIKRTARQVKGPATLELWEKHLEGTRPLGVVPIMGDALCAWGSIDIDDYDVVSADVIRKIESAKLPLLPCRSKSGGLHLFMFTSKPVTATLMRTTLSDIAASIGYAGCEIFPKQTRLLVEKGDQGNWMVMPYFGGTYDGKLREQVGIKRTGAEMLVGEFLSAAEKMRVSPEDIAKVRAPNTKKPRKERPPFSDGPPCLVHLTSRAGGIPQGGQNNTLFHMGVYFRRADPENWKRRLEEANQKWFTPPYPSDKLSLLMKSLDKKDYQYKCKDQPMVSHCDAMQCRTRKFGVGAAGTYPEITSISKLNSEPPIWFVDVEGARISMSTEELQTYVKFHRLCMEHVHKSFATISQAAWFGVLNEVMARGVRDMDTSEDVKPGAQFLELLRQFLTDRGQGRNKEDVATGRPFLDEDEKLYYFQLAALRKFLDREGMKDLAKHSGRITTMIKELGGNNHQFNLKGVGNRFVWWIPFDVIGSNRPMLEGPKAEEGEL
jgi:hypothetical protein